MPNYELRTAKLFANVPVSFAIFCMAVLLVALPAFASTLFAQQTGQQEQVRNPELRDVLLQRMDLDQQARAQIVESIRRSETGTPTADVVEQRNVVDKANREWLAEYLVDRDWPGRSEVGKDGAHAAWIIVQHANDDMAFQRRCLSMMRNAPQGEVASIDIAYLTDRVLVRSGKNQIYGTQVQMNGGEFRIASVHEPEKLNARREAIGLESIETYLDTIRANYQARNGQSPLR